MYAMWIVCSILLMKGNTLATLISTTGSIHCLIFNALVAAGVMFGYMIGVDQRNKKVAPSTDA